jgi:hypothetical protein
MKCLTQSTSQSVRFSVRFCVCLRFIAGLPGARLKFFSYIVHSEISFLWLMNIHLIWRKLLAKKHLVDLFVSAYLCNNPIGGCSGSWNSLSKSGSYHRRLHHIGIHWSLHRVMLWQQGGHYNLVLNRKLCIQTSYHPSFMVHWLVLVHFKL